jgi:hypothetical protein
MIRDLFCSGQGRSYRPSEVRLVAEIVCISCWQGFESDAGDDEEVTCPSCGHTQPALAAREAAAKGEAPSEGASGEAVAEPGDGAAGDPFDGIEDELVFDLEDGEDPALTRTAEFGKVEDPQAGAGEAEAAKEPEAEEPAADEGAEEAEEEESPEAEEEDNRWRFRSGSGLVLFFPTYEVAAKWAVKQSPEDLAIARGTGDFRPFRQFEAALKTLGDPVLAIAAHGDEDGGDAPSPEGSETATRDELPPTEEEPAAQDDAASAGDPVAEVSPPAASAAGKGKQGHRTTTMTSEFKFRTGEEVRLWPGRLLFFVLGLLLGSGVVYFTAWYGLLPGILY